MKAFIDFLPVLLFFLSYIFYGNIPVEGSRDERKKQEASRRFYLYKEYTSHIYGVLGKGVSVGKLSKNSFNLQIPT